jgi:hypothetical protein
MRDAIPFSGSPGAPPDPVGPATAVVDDRFVTEALGSPPSRRIVSEARSEESLAAAVAHVREALGRDSRSLEAQGRLYPSVNRRAAPSGSSS